MSIGDCIEKSSVSFCIVLVSVCVFAIYRDVYKYIHKHTPLCSQDCCIVLGLKVLGLWRSLDKHVHEQLSE